VKKARLFSFFISGMMFLIVGCNIVIDNNQENTDLRQPFLTVWYTTYYGQEGAEKKIFDREFEFIIDSTYNFSQKTKDLTGAVKELREQSGTWSVTKTNLTVNVTKAYLTITGFTKKPDSIRVKTIDYEYLFKSSTVSTYKDSLLLSFRQKLYDDLGNLIKDTTLVFHYNR
jgi:hypothetical protein